MRQIEDKDYSLSFSYFQSIRQTVSLTLEGYGQKALSEVGKSFYNNGTNEYFGITCGDEYITAYQQGGWLLLNINIHFHSHYDKQQFEINAGTSFGNMFSASTDIEKTATKLNIHGQVGITAFQAGGNPAELGKILSKDASGNYYTLYCNLSNMSACKKAAGGLLDYANKNFSNQFGNVSSMTPLGLGFMSKSKIKYIGLKQPVSLVTGKVVQARLDLDDKYEENVYYHEKLYQLIEGYSVKWDVYSNLYNSINTLYLKIKTNLNIITDPSGRTRSAVDCFNFPDECPDIAKKIISQLSSITKDDLIFMPKIAYAYEIFTGRVYKTGDTPSSWSAVLSPIAPHLANVHQILITNKEYDFNGIFEDAKGNTCPFYPLDANNNFQHLPMQSTDNGNSFSGWTIVNECRTGINKTYEKRYFHKIPSHYDFEIYNNTIGKNSTLIELIDEI